MTRIFRKILGIDKDISIKELETWFESSRILTTSIVAVLHTKILSLIIRDGETPDEDRLLDEDTWPEVMRQVSVYAVCTSYMQCIFPVQSILLSLGHSILKIRMESTKTILI